MNSNKTSNMKKIISGVALLCVLQACGPNSTESGVDNDGIKAVDRNGALPDDTTVQANPSIDTAKGEHRVDISRRDSLNQ
jgi:hypothetical protein